MARDLVNEALALLVHTDDAGPILAVKICGSRIGDFWLHLDTSSPFDPGDGLPVHTIAKLRFLAGQGHGQDTLQAVTRTKSILHGRIVK